MEQCRKKMLTMPDLITHKKNAWQPYALLLLLACIIYFPLALGIFSLKNDGLIYFLTWRYHVSESIQAGNFPFWNPYLFTGLPMHSDMQSGVWNPVVLIISLFTRYNMRVLELELLIYLFMAAAGMYTLVRKFNASHTVAIGIAVSYMCCGFITDSASFIPWIICAAYLPFVFAYFYTLLQQPSLRGAVLFSIFLALLFTAGNPSYFIFCAYILGAAFICWLLYVKQRAVIVDRLKYFGLSAAFVILLTAPAIFSYLEFLPYYYRGSGANLQQALVDPFPPFSSISFLLPNAVAKPHEWLDTDVAMRNSYLGIFGLLFFFVTLGGPLRARQKFLLGVLLFSFLFSLGDFTPLRKWCYQFLPLMNTFRHPAISRIFTIMGMLLLAADALEQLMAKGLNYARLKKITLVLAGCLLALLIYYACTAKGISTVTTGSGTIKSRIDALSFQVIAAGQAIIQLVFVIIFLLVLRRKKFIPALMIVNVTVFAWMALPFTVLSQLRVSEVNHYLNSFPAGYPLPDIASSIQANDRSMVTTDGPYGYSKFFTKKILIQDNIISPTINTDYTRFLGDSLLRIKTDKLPFAYVSSAATEMRDSSATVTVESFNPSAFLFRIKTTTGGGFHLFQQYHHYWKAAVNRIPAKISKDNVAFMKIAVPAGDTEILFEYTPPSFLWLFMYLSVILFLALLIYLFFPSLKKAMPDKYRR